MTGLIDSIDTKSDNPAPRQLLTSKAGKKVFCLYKFLKSYIFKDFKSFKDFRPQFTPSSGQGTPLNKKSNLN